MTWNVPQLYPWSRGLWCLGVDFMGPFPFSRENKHILMAIDYVSKWVEAIASPTNDASVVTKFFKRVIFPRFRVPRVLTSDGGTYFIEWKVKPMLTEFGVHDKKQLGYHAQTSGQIEVSNWEIKFILEKTVARSRKDWPTSFTSNFGPIVPPIKLPLEPCPYDLSSGSCATSSLR